MKISKANAADCPGLLQIFESQPDHENNFSCQTSVSLVAFLKNNSCFQFKNLQSEVIGFVIYNELPRVWDILFIMVTFSYRRQGFGQEFMMLFKEMAITQGVEEIWLEVHEKNVQAIHLYHKIGFKKVGIRPHYYPDGGSCLNMTWVL